MVINRPIMEDKTVSRDKRLIQSAVSEATEAMTNVPGTVAGFGSFSFKVEVASAGGQLSDSKLRSSHNLRMKGDKAVMSESDLDLLNET